GNSLTSPLPLTAPAGRRQDREPKESIVTNELRFIPALTLLEDFGPNGQCGVTLSDYCSGSDDVATVQTFVSKQAAEIASTSPLSNSFTKIVLCGCLGLR